ncbi:uncharacterized protein BJ212DRAFT_1300913 [Suillus subaureus]|uniref:C2H2-type domain-containing protein n=1 Tax=Suillus subaureus TaxID=48587 RepID=A0A9P7JBW5_9AGAM|nr:uncharacterized protein BJ212DRAFT_1300913 [Suillus subaureus]KAG1813499.1 hypothetical protein BJ212DRAFT_1300913 [Suillus subaureus]
MQRALLWPLALLLAFIFLSMPEIVPHTQVAWQDFSTFQVPCSNVGCKCFFKTTAGHTKHILSAHPIVSPPASPEPHISHPNNITDNPFQDSKLLGQPNGDGDEALQASPPPNIHTEFFGSGNLLYCNYHTSLNDHKDLYATINSITLGNVKWEGFSCTYTGKKPDGYPSWMDGTYDVWYQDLQEVILNMLANPAYANEMDYRPYHKYTTNGDEQQL